jgi:hypothetical protein
MKIAHLILAHKAPQQLARLLAALAHPDVQCYVHLDLKTAAAPFGFLRRQRGVQLTQTRNRVTWGGYSQTQNLVDCLREILAQATPFEFINVLSGQDYPLCPAEVVQEFLRARRGESFLATEPPGGPWWQASRYRVARYHLTEFEFPGRYAVQQALNKLLPARRFPLAGPLHGGPVAGWCTLSREAAAYIVRFMDGHARLRRFARFTWGSDEFVVPTVLLNSPLAATVANDSLRYTDWAGGGANPKILTLADLPALQACGKLWARKFDAGVDVAVLDALDRAVVTSMALSAASQLVTQVIC